MRYIKGLVITIIVAYLCSISMTNAQSVGVGSSPTMGTFIPYEKLTWENAALTWDVQLATWDSI